MAERPQGYCLRRRPLQHPAEPETWDLGTLTTAYQAKKLLAAADAADLQLAGAEPAPAAAAIPTPAVPACPAGPSPDSEMLQLRAKVWIKVLPTTCHVRGLQLRSCTCNTMLPNLFRVPCSAGVPATFRTVPTCTTYPTTTWMGTT